MKTDATVRMWPAESSGNANLYTFLIQSEKIKYINHTWKSSLDFKFDIFHVHWPELYLNKPNWFLSIFGNLVVALYLIAIKLMGKKIVWTVHNLKPHEMNGDLGRQLSCKLIYSLLHRVVDKYIVLNKANVDNLISSGVPSEDISVIAHPLYPTKMENTFIKNRALFFGYIRKYKNVELLLEQFNRLEPSKSSVSDHTLCLLGKCDEEEILKVFDEQKGNPSIEIYNKSYSEQELDEQLSLAQGVIVPYRNINNSGVIIKALSAGLPLLVPNIPYIDELRETFPNHPFYTYEDELSTDDLNNFANYSYQVRQENKIPAIDQFNESVSSSHAQLYAQLITTASPNARLM